MVNIKLGKNVSFLRDSDVFCKYCINICVKLMMFPIFRVNLVDY
ncbi:Uncharacterised protein [Wolbachia endosymbiont wPip_Mol of Culex molestus]|nr:Uncharacterised protein [Wolbachia endosymbiont wPip_Mol of Culex molestus]